MRDELAVINPDAVVFDDFDEAIIGYVQVFGLDPIACYDYQKCVDIFVSTACPSVTEEEAMEYIDFNMVGAGLGPGTPAFLYKFNEYEYDE